MKMGAEWSRFQKIKIWKGQSVEWITHGNAGDIFHESKSWGETQECELKS